MTQEVDKPRAMIRKEKREKAIKTVGTVLGSVLAALMLIALFLVIVSVYVDGSNRMNVAHYCNVAGDEEKCLEYQQKLAQN